MSAWLILSDGLLTARIPKTSSEPTSHQLCSNDNFFFLAQPSCKMWPLAVFMATSQQKLRRKSGECHTSDLLSTNSPNLSLKQLLFFFFFFLSLDIRTKSRGAEPFPACQEVTWHCGGGGGRWRRGEFQLWPVRIAVTALQIWPSCVRSPCCWFKPG